jgi:hypothetical protein
MTLDDKINAVLQRAVDAVKARNNGALPADDLCLFLAAEIVARDETLTEVGQVCAKRIVDNLEMDSRRREVALRAHVEDLTAALEFYATADHYRLNDYPNGTRPIWDDYGAKARAALGSPNGRDEGRR